MSMVVKGCSKNLGAVTLIIWWRLYYAFAQPGEFLSIDCGGKSSRTDTDTNITWVPDERFIDVGYSRVIHNSTSTPFYFQSQRVFPNTSKKSCYQLPLKPNVPHLLRIWFAGENYSTDFKYSIETPGMLSQSDAPSPSTPPESNEYILVSSGKVLFVCLIRNSSVDPFISAIELRPLRPDMYTESKVGKMLNLGYRSYAGGYNQSSPLRYPQDPFDRLWYDFSQTDARLPYRSSSKSISNKDTRDRPPSAVMHTVLTTSEKSMLFDFNTPLTWKSLLILYFADVELQNDSDSRSFHVFANGHDPITNITLANNHSAIELRFPPLSPITQLIIEKAPSSRYAPIINAFEHYCLVETENATSPDDVGALNDLKERFSFFKWVSDPCFAVPWEGIQCTPRTTKVRIIELNLSGRNLTGSVPPILAHLNALINMTLDNNHLAGALPDMSNFTQLERLHLRKNNFTGKFPDWLSKLSNLKELLLDNNQLSGKLPDLSNLTKLEKLHLQNNSLSGEVPVTLSKLQNLKELFLQNNNFSGLIPQQLSDRASLNLKFEGNNLLINSSSNSKSNSPSKERKVGIIVGVTVGGVALVALAVLFAIMLYRRKFRKKETIKSIESVTSRDSIHAHDKDYSMVLVPTPTKSRAFTLDEMLKATENFTQKIGEGGFGSVFLGKLEEGKQIAVKVLSYFSKQGVVEFLNEIDLLSKVNHKNLVSLLGYCNEARELMLVYGYMPRGSLKEHLYGPKAGEHSNLDWKTRLKIVLDAAKGLEYLHVACTPKIIHRDVKTANILLDDNLNGRLSDFGLSRVTVDGEASHITTTVKGTAGYLDPEYFSTQMLTEKSDVYSFGVVLLEIICGRRPIDSKLAEEEVNLIRWVTPNFETIEDTDKIKEIVDKTLGNDYDSKSMINVGRLALRCVAAEPSSRPNISEIVVEIKEAIKYETERVASFIEASENIIIEDLEDSQVSIPDSYGPKEVGSSDNSANFTQGNR